jgi:hypothetical protein
LFFDLLAGIFPTSLGVELVRLDPENLAQALPGEKT